MSQKLDDLKLLLKNDKRLWFAGGFIVLVLFVWMLTDQTPRRVRRPEEQASKQGMGAEEQFGDLIRAFDNEIKASKDEQAEMRAVITRTNTELKEHKERVTGIFENLVDRFEQLSREVDTLASTLNKQTAEPLPVPRPIEAPEEGVEKFGEELPPPPPPPAPPRRPRVSVIMPGDSVDVTLLTGVNAPVDGTPYPVVFQLNGSVGGPDGSSLELGEARLIAAAQGSEVDSRALFRLSSLSMRHPSGRRSVIKVDGWVIGEDGVRGMKGTLIDKLGRLILATAGVSFAAALGDRLDGSRGRFTNNREPGLSLRPNDFDVAAASALTDASNRLGKVLLDRYESFVPVVEILSNREAVAIFSQPAEISILEDDEADYGEVVAAGYGE